MTPGQLVIRGPERSRGALDLVLNERGAPPDSFEDAAGGVRIPRFGGAALLRAAATAISKGYAVRRFEFGGAGERTLTSGTSADDASHDVVTALVSFGIGRAEGVLHNDYRSYVICGVQLYSDNTRVVTLRRDGVVLGRDADAIWTFVQSVLIDGSAA